MAEQQKYEVPTPKERGWDNPDQMGVVLVDDIDRSKIPNSETREVREWVSNVRKLRTFLGANKEIIQANPWAEKVLQRIIVLHVVKLVLKDSSMLGNFLPMEVEIQTVLDKLAVDQKFSDLPESTFFDAQYLPTLTLAFISARGYSRNMPDQAVAEYEAFKSGASMIWTLTQGSLMGISRYIGYSTAMLAEGYSLQEVVDINVNQISIAGIEVHEVNGKKGTKNVYISSGIVDRIRNGKLVEISAEQDFYSGYVVEEMIASGGTVRRILEELLAMLDDDELIKNVVVLEGARQQWLYSWDEDNNQHVWKRPQVGSLEIRVDALR